jgi:16S rRNA processing protein RimM
METIPLAGCTKIGYLQRPHGVKGEIVLSFDDGFEESVEQAKIFFVKLEGYLVPFFPEEGGVWVRTSKQAQVKFRWVDSGEKAREYSGSEVFLKTSELKISDKSITPQALTGFEVFDSLKAKIGLVAGVNNYSGNIVLSVSRQGREILIPFNPAMVLGFDVKKKFLQMEIPEGLTAPDNL